MADATSSSSVRFYFVVAVTLLRIPLAVVFAALILCCQPSVCRMYIALMILGVVELSDILDGILARKLKVVTEAGAAMDPWADSISRLVIYWALAISGIVLAIVPLVMAVRDVTVSYCRIIITRKGKSAKAMFSGKIKAIIQGGGAILLTAGPIYLDWTGPWPLATASWIILVVTAVSAIEYISAAMRK